MALVLTDNQQVELAIKPLTVKGNPAPIDGVPVWTVSDDTVLSVSPNSDGLSASVVATGKLGTSQVNVTADADLGDGSTEITGVLDVEVKAGSAVSLNIEAGAPSEQ